MSVEKLEVFNVLNFLNNGYKLDEILNEGSFTTFQSVNTCIEYLLENEYIDVKEDELTEDAIGEKYTVMQLKELLKENGQKISGKKEELIKRIIPILKQTDDYYEITDKAKEFITENEWIDLYMFALIAFHFEDYEKYVSKSTHDNITTALNFCDEIISMALINNLFLIFIEALSAKAHVYAYYNDYESFMDYDLQRFILGLNPITMDAQTYKSYEIINEANIINLKNVNEYLNVNLKKKFDKIWDKSHITDITVPKKASYKVLIKAIAGADLDELNFDLKEKYFDKKFRV